VSAFPGEVYVGASMSLLAAAHDSNGGPSPITYAWTTAGGTLSAANVASPSLKCTAAGPVTVTVTVSDGDCSDTLSTTVKCTGGAFTTMDLSKYVRVGRFGLPEPTRTTPPNSTSLLAQEASSVTYN